MKIRRKQIIVNPKIQFKLIFLTFISTFIPMLLTFLSLFFILQSILLEAQLDNAVLYNTLLFISKKLYVVLTLGFTLISFLLICWSMIFIHRIVGPIHRLETELDKVIAGKKIHKIRFRKYDYFTSVADKVNIIITKLRQEQAN